MIFLSGGKVFLIRGEEKSQIELFFDHTEIRKEDFDFIVKKEVKCASFYIHLVVTPIKSNKPVFSLSVSEDTFL